MSLDQMQSLARMTRNENSLSVTGDPDHVQTWVASNKFYWNYSR